MKSEIQKKNNSGCNRTDGILTVVGDDLLDKIKYSNVFMIGAGAIGYNIYFKVFYNFILIITDI